MLRVNHKPYVMKRLGKAIMYRSYLENKYYKYRTPVHWQAYKKQKNYCNRLYKRERKRYYSNLNLSNITDNKKFWNTVKPLFSEKGRGKENIVLVNGNKIISDDLEVAQTFNDFFKHSVNALNIQENQLLLTQTNRKLNSVKGAIDKFQNHPSVISKNKVNMEEIEFEIKHLDNKKVGTLMNIPTKQLKQVIDIVVDLLMEIWNVEIVQYKKYPRNLKLADISPIYKKLEKILVVNY